MQTKSLIDQIQFLLPQTQCTRCGFASCRLYAKAIVEQKTAINYCPTGGKSGIKKLARLLNKVEPLLDESHGREKPRSIAVIDESKCIGCTLCIQACPVDAIIGASKMMHAIINEYCTGCELCLPRCPVDCIKLENVSGIKTGWEAWTQKQADQALQRFERHQTRLNAEKKQLNQINQESNQNQTSKIDKKSALIQKAIERAKAKSGQFNI